MRHLHSLVHFIKNDALRLRLRATLCLNLALLRLSIDLQLTLFVSLESYITIGRLYWVCEVFKLTHDVVYHPEGSFDMQVRGK